MMPTMMTNTAHSPRFDRAVAALALALMLAVAPAAGADSADSQDSATRPRRQGFAFGIGLGTGATSGFGGFDIQGLGGTGGSLSLHVGTTASERMLWLVQLDVAADPDTQGDSTVVNQHSTLTLGAQYYVREVVWVKGGLGFSGLVLGRDPEATNDIDRRMSGLGLMSAGGYDLLRSGLFALSLELAGNAGVYGQGLIASMAVRLSANWY
jgi:hypothetical protein